jgi:hypothetical protein
MKKSACTLVGIAAFAIAWMTGCASEHRIDLEAIYGERARATATTRTPVVVIPGILGSKLYDPASQRNVWGAFPRTRGSLRFQWRAVFLLPILAMASQHRTRSTR